MPKFEQICRKFDAAMKMLPVLCQLVFSEDDLPLTIIQKHIQRFAEILPQLSSQFDNELIFKRNSLIDFSLCNATNAKSLFSTIFLSWNIEIYLDFNLFSEFYSLIL